MYIYIVLKLDCLRRFERLAHIKCGSVRSYTDRSDFAGALFRITTQALTFNTQTENLNKLHI